MMGMSDEAQVAAEVKKGTPGFVKLLLTILIPLLIGGALGVYVIQMKPELIGLSKGQAQVQAETDSLVSEVGKLISLPTDEKPTVASITDIEKLKDQPFFKNAKNGDRVLIFTNAKKAILYRQSEKRIIEVGAVNINQQAPETSASPVPETSPSPEATP